MLLLLSFFKISSPAILAPPQAQDEKEENLLFLLCFSFYYTLFINLVNIFDDYLSTTLKKYLNKLKIR